MKHKQGKQIIPAVWFLIFIMLFSVAGPQFVSHNPKVQKLEHANIPPIIGIYEVNGIKFILNNAKKILLFEDGRISEMLPLNGENTDFEGYETLQNLKVTFENEQMTVVDEKGEKLRPTRCWNRTYLLGTDNLGRDLLVRLMYAGKVSLFVALAAVLSAGIIGGLYGCAAALSNKTIDSFMMRILDIISSIPIIMYYILIMVWLGNGISSILIAVCSVSWINTARTVRGGVKNIRQLDYFILAELSGIKFHHLVLKYIFPNIIHSVVVTLITTVPTAIFTESTLSFVGIGIAAPMSSWGAMCRDALGALRQAPYQTFLPALAISLTVMSVNAVGNNMAGMEERHQ